MKLEVGKKYTLRDRPDVKWVRIDAIREDCGSLFECVVGLMFYKERQTPSNWFCCPNGSYMRGVKDHHNDLVAEYKELMICITEKDVGRKARTRDGSVFLITGFNHGFSYPVQAGGYTYMLSGHGSNIEAERPYDLVAFVD